MGEEDSQCEVDVSSEPKTENVARDEVELELHRAVFHGDLADAVDSLERGASATIQDRFGVCDGYRARRLLDTCIAVHVPVLYRCVSNLGSVYFRVCVYWIFSRQYATSHCCHDGTQR